MKWHFSDIVSSEVSAAACVLKFYLRTSGPVLRQGLGIMDPPGRQNLFQVQN